MSLRTITKSVLTCDGCGVELDEHPNSTEARAAAYSLGWRFPSKVNTKGRAVKSTSDACPKCVPTWQPQTDANSAKWTDERKTKHAETMRGYFGGNA